MSLVPTLEELKREIVKSVLTNEQLEYVKKGYRNRARDTIDSASTIQMFWTAGIGTMMREILFLEDGSPGDFRIFELKTGLTIDPSKMSDYISRNLRDIKESISYIADQIQQAIDKRDEDQQKLVTLQKQL